MIVTLDIFSGRPNPSWKISDKKAKELVDRVAHRALADAQQVDNALGFRGFVVSSPSDDALPQHMPATFRIGGAMAAGMEHGDGRKAALSADEVDDSVRWLLATGEHAIPDAVMEAVRDEIETASRALAQPPAAEAAADEVESAAKAAAAAAACVIANTAYNPGFWNVPAVQPYNNCYNYAMNHRSDTFAQPGRISGHPNSVMQCAQVAAAANWDGCLAVCSGSNKNVALVIWPGVDYHWYRRHSEGFWGHKPGSTAARNTDNAGQLINGTTRTPANCNRGPYTIFCGYRFSPTGMKVK